MFLVCVAPVVIMRNPCYTSIQNVKLLPTYSVLQMHGYMLHTDYCLDLSPTNMIFNTSKMHSKDKISQVIMLIARHYIYSTKCTGYALSLYACIDCIIYYKNIEKYIAIHNNVERSFYSKWISFEKI